MLRTTEEDKEETEEATTSVAASTEIGMDVAVQRAALKSFLSGKNVVALIPTLARIYGVFHLAQKLEFRLGMASHSS